MAGIRRHWWRILVIIAAVLLLPFALSVGWAYVAPLSSATTPEGTVVRYYQLRARGCLADAQSLYAPEVNAVWYGPSGRIPVFARDELLGATGISTDGAGPGEPDGSQGHDYTYHYHDFASVNVHFWQWFGDDMTTSAGGQFREVLLGRKDARSPWVILEMGTGG